MLYWTSCKPFSNNSKITMLPIIFRVSRDLFARQRSFATVLSLIPASSDTVESEEAAGETALKVTPKNLVHIEVKNWFKGNLSSARKGFKVVYRTGLIWMSAFQFSAYLVAVLDPGLRPLRIFCYANHRGRRPQWTGPTRCHAHLSPRRTEELQVWLVLWWASLTAFPGRSCSAVNF